MSGGGQRRNALTRVGRDPHCETCATPQKTPVFPELQTWYNPTHHLANEKTSCKWPFSDTGVDCKDKIQAETEDIAPFADSLGPA